jgi:hypothetical protein
MLRHAAAIIGILLIGSLGNALVPATSLAQQPGGMQNLFIGLPEGVSMMPLAAVSVDPLPGSETRGLGLQLMLERIPLSPGEIHDGRDPEQGGEGPSFRGNQAARGTHLLIVESGEAVLVMNGGEEPFTQGLQLLVPEEVAYELRNETGECLSLLRLSAVTIGGGAGVTPSDEVPNLPPICPEPSMLLRGGGLPIFEQTILFMARVTWEPGSRSLTTNAHPGPTGLRLESGTLEVMDREAETFGLSSHIDQDGWLDIGENHSYAVFNDGSEPATALMVGAIPADEPLWSTPQ